jgi:hypothetical protein
MTTIEAYIYPQPAARRVCSTCHAQMVNVGRDVWVCPTQAIEPKGVSEPAAHLSARWLPSAQA